MGNWGRLANSQVRDLPLRAVYFFAGDSTGDHHYTRHPRDAANLHWSAGVENRSAVLSQMIDAGVNTIVMSNWGERGYDRWTKWARMATSPGACEVNRTGNVGGQLV